MELRGGLKIYENLLKILRFWALELRGTSWNFVELRGTSCNTRFPLIFHVLGVFCQIAPWFTGIHCADVRFCWFSYLWTIFAKLELGSLESNMKRCIPNDFQWFSYFSAISSTLETDSSDFAAKIHFQWFSNHFSNVYLIRAWFTKLYLIRAQSQPSRHHRSKIWKDTDS